MSIDTLTTPNKNTQGFAHFDTVADSYDSVNIFNGVGGGNATEIFNQVISHVSAALQISTGDVIADIGGGNGVIAEAICKTQPNVHFVVVDPSAAMLKKAQQRGLETVEMEALQFVQTAFTPGHPYQTVLLMSMIHHLEPTERREMFAHLYETLPIGGKIVIVTRPDDGGELPLFNKARIAWKANCPEHNQLPNDVKTAGFATTTQQAQIKIKIPTELWFEFIRRRTWSDFANMTNEELEAGIDELKTTYNQSETLEFNDQLIIIRGIKP